MFLDEIYKRMKGLQIRLWDRRDLVTRHQKDEEDEGYWMKYTTWMTFADEILRSHRLASETGGTCELLRRDKKTKKKRKTTTCDGEEDEAHVVCCFFPLGFRTLWEILAMSMATTSVIRSVSATTIQSCSSSQVRFGFWDRLAADDVNEWFQISLCLFSFFPRRFSECKFW